MFGVSSAGANAALAKSDIGVRKDQSVGDLDARRQKDIDLAEASWSANTEKWIGDKAIKASGMIGNGIRGATKDRGPGPATIGKVGGAVVEVGGGAVGSYLQYKSIQDKAAGQTSAANVSTDKLIAIRNARPRD